MTLVQSIHDKWLLGKADMSTCVCVCVCKRERERGEKNECLKNWPIKYKSYVLKFQQ